METRWASNNAMADYSSEEPNIAAIINANQDVLVPGSVQILRMQSEAEEYQDAPNKTYDRLAGALLWPVGILAFSALVVFFLSRIYLTLSDLNGERKHVGDRSGGWHPHSDPAHRVVFRIAPGCAALAVGGHGDRHSRHPGDRGNGRGDL